MLHQKFIQKFTILKISDQYRGKDNARSCVFQTANIGTAGEHRLLEDTNEC